MKELDDLMRQKKEIEERIKQLSGTPVYKRCKVDIETYPSRSVYRAERGDRYFLAVKYHPLDNGRAKYQTIFASRNKQEVIDEIPKIIEELQGLYDLTKL